MRIVLQVVEGKKVKERMGQGQEGRRMGPNARGWIEKTKDMFDY